MKFTLYYSKLIKSQGFPHLSGDEHARFMNKVFIEDAMHHISKIKAEGDSKVNIGKRNTNYMPNFITLLKN